MPGRFRSQLGDRRYLSRLVSLCQWLALYIERNNLAGEVEPGCIRVFRQRVKPSTAEMDKILARPSVTEPDLCRLY